MISGSKIKLIRELRNISREQMADDLNMSLSTYKKIEQNERLPNLNELKLLSEILNVQPTALFIDGNTLNLILATDQEAITPIPNPTLEVLLSQILESINNLNKTLEKISDFK